MLIVSPVRDQISIQKRWQYWIKVKQIERFYCILLLLIRKIMLFLSGKFERTFGESYVVCVFFLLPLCRVALKPQLRLPREKSRQEISATRVWARNCHARVSCERTCLLYPFCRIYFRGYYHRDETVKEYSSDHDEILILS